jgi:hypothetical protein
MKQAVRYLAESALDVTGKQYQYDYVVNYLVEKIFPQLDAHGTVTPADSSRIALTVSGPGSIVGPIDVVMKGGQLAVRMRTGRTPGAITLTAGAPGLTSASLILTSQAVPGLPPKPADRTDG